MRVEFKYKDGRSKEFSRVFGLEMERKGHGKIVREIPENKFDLKRAISDLEKREKALSIREKSLKPESNKADKKAVTRQTK